MRIALVSPPFISVPPPDYGGTELVVGELARSLTNRGHETVVYATGDSDLGFMQIPAGTVGGVYGYHRGWVDDRNVVSVGFNWTMGEHVVPPKPLAHGHVIQVFTTRRDAKLTTEIEPAARFET